MESTEFHSDTRNSKELQKSRFNNFSHSNSKLIKYTTFYSKFEINFQNLITKDSGSISEKNDKFAEIIKSDQSGHYIFFLLVELILCHSWLRPNLSPDFDCRYLDLILLNYMCSLIDGFPSLHYSGTLIYLLSFFVLLGHISIIFYKNSSYVLHCYNIYKVLIGIACQYIVMYF